jgi:hypothetical protein
MEDTMDDNDNIGIELLIGRRIVSAVPSASMTELKFTFADGSAVLMHHEQNCCESVWLADVTGLDLADLAGAEILAAVVVSGEDERDYSDRDYYKTWSFYNLVTSKGHVTLRWNTQSNGYYSIEVQLKEV